jgi:hypothetical protein
MASRTWLGSSIESAVMACKATTHMHVCRSGLGREKPGIIEDVVGLWSEARRVRGRRFKFYLRRDRQISAMLAIIARWMTCLSRCTNSAFTVEYRRLQSCTSETNLRGGLELYRVYTDVSLDWPESTL